MITAIIITVQHPDLKDQQFPSLLHAFTASLDAGEANPPRIAVEDCVNIEFKDADEVIRDIARNRAATYAMSRWELEGRNIEETQEGTVTADELIQWIVDSIDLIFRYAYAYDRKTRRGSYSFNMNLSGGYQFVEKD